MREIRIPLGRHAGQEELPSGLARRGVIRFEVVQDHIPDPLQFRLEFDPAWLGDPIPAGSKLRGLELPPGGLVDRDPRLMLLVGAGLLVGSATERLAGLADDPVDGPLHGGLGDGLVGGLDDGLVGGLDDGLLVGGGFGAINGLGGLGHLAFSCTMNLATRAKR